MISSRTPEGEPNCCPVCRKQVVLEPSQPVGDAPCPHCGCLLRFEAVEGEVRVSVAGLTSSEVACPKCHVRIPVHRETEAPLLHCPACQQRLWTPAARNFPGMVQAFLGLTK